MSKQGQQQPQQEEQPENNTNNEILADNQFASAGLWTSIKPPLSTPVLQTLEQLKFTQMTPVQARTIPLFLTHKDVIAEVRRRHPLLLSLIIDLSQQRSDFSIEFKVHQH
jgi:ATP-dependent RNA helicase DDX55/SPB4